VALLRGLEESALEQVANRLKITEGAEHLISTLRTLGYKTAILSGGFTFFARHLQSRLGMDYVYANELDIADGRVTGKISGTIVDGARKAELLRRLAEEELGRTRRQRAARLVDEADVLRAQDAVHLTQSVLRNIEAAWAAARAELARLAASDQALGDGPDFDLYAIPGAIPDAAAVDTAVARSRLVRAIDIQRRQLARLQAGNAEVARPDLALNLSGALLGGDESMGDSFALDHPDVGVALELRYPLGNRTAEADLATTRLELRQLAYARGEAEVTLRSGMEGIVTRLDGLGEVLALDVQRIETARRKTEEEQLLYERGRGNLTFVIQSRDGEAIARLDYAEHAARYHELLLQYRALADQLLSDAEAR